MNISAETNTFSIQSCANTEGRGALQWLSLIILLQGPHFEDSMSGSRLKWHWYLHWHTLSCLVIQESSGCNRLLAANHYQSPYKKSLSLPRKCFCLVVFEQKCHSDQQLDRKLNSEWHDPVNSYWTSPEGSKDWVKAAYIWAYKKPTQKKEWSNLHS